jgi:radical SAM-linked protein
VETVDVKQPAATQLLTQAEYILNIGAAREISLDEWQSWIDRVINIPEIIQSQTTKSGKKKEVNLRDRLFNLTLLPQDSTVNYQGSCVNDGTLLRPEQVVYMLEQVSGEELELIKVTRSRLILGVVAVS